MKSNCEILAKEALVTFGMIFVLILILWCIGGVNESFIDGCSGFSQRIVDLNLALIIAMILSAIMENKIKVKRRSLKKIARRSFSLILFNSLMMAFGSFLGIFDVAVVVAGLYGNLAKMWDICRYVLELM